MLGFLLTISFTLHILTIYMIFILYKKNQIGQVPIENNIEDLLETYIKEIKDENQKLQNLLIKESQQLRNPKRESEGRISKANFNAYEQLNIDEYNDENDKIETSFQAKVLALHKQGFSVEEIAKQLQGGKTEIELILKFYEGE